MNRERLLGIAVVGALVTAPMTGLAQTRSGDTGLYAGGGLGYYSVDERGFDEDGMGLKAYLGAQILPWLGAEAHYADIGRIDNSDLEVQGLGVAVVGMLPLGSITPYAKVGQFFWDVDTPMGDDDGNDPFGGVGVQFALNDRVDLRVEYERYKFDDVDADTGWVNAQVRF